MSRREFKFEAGESRKFWAIERSGSSFTVTFGRIGTAGQSRTKAFSSEAECVKAHDKLIAEKFREGYVESSGQKSAATKKGTNASSKKAAAVPTKKRLADSQDSGTNETKAKKSGKADPGPAKTPTAVPQSADPLLKSLQQRNGKLLPALKAIKGQGSEKDGRLKKVSLRYTEITDEGMVAFAEETDIVDLELGPKMTDRALVHLAGMTKMQSLGLHDMRLTGDGLKHLAGMEKLHSLSLFDSEVSEEALSHLPPLPSLRRLNLGACQVTDAALKHLARQTGVTHLWLGQALVTGPGLANLAPLTNLEELDLHESALTDEGLKHLAAFKELKQLELNRTAVTDAGMASLALLPSLDMLLLEWTNISDAAIPDLARCKKLRIVNADETLVTAEGVKQFKSLRPRSTLRAVTKERVKPKVVALELVERPTQRTPAPVAESWKRIDAWLEANAPAVRKSLRGPASESDLNRLEETIGQPLPDDVRGSYLIHDGQNCLDIDEDERIPGVFFGLFPLPLFYDEGVEWCWKNRISSEPDHYKEVSPDTPRNRLTSYPPGAVRLAQMRPGWVPLYWDSGRSFMGIDLDPGPKGISGQVIPFGWGLGLGDEERWVLAQSWAHFLEDIADELEAGHAAVESPEVAGDNWYYLKGTPKGYLWNSIREWSKAKLPRAFQEGTG